MLKHLSLCFLIAVSCYADITDTKLKNSGIALEKIVPDAMKKLGVPGCAIAIVRDDKIVLIKCFGKANEKKEEITPDTVFQLSSLTKTITAILVCKMVELGTINLDDKVRKYVPDFFIGNEYVSSIFTIRDLISHRSGFKHFIGDTLWSCGYSTKQIIDALANINNVSDFRKKYGYQNVIFALVQNVLENATNKTYEDLLHEYVFTPLNLKQATVKPIYTKSSLIENFKYNYKKFGFFSAVKLLFSFKKERIIDCYSIYNGKVVKYKNSDICQKLPATAGVGMSINDFCKILMMLLKNGKGYIDASVLHSFLVPHVNVTTNRETIMFPKERMTDISYCVGFFKAKYANHNVYFHTGGVHGASAYYAFFPDDNFGICVMCNLGGTATTLFTEAVAYELLDKIFETNQIDWIKKEETEKIKQQELSKKYDDNMQNNFPVPHGKLTDYCSTYNNKVYGPVEITAKNNKLYMYIVNLDLKIKLHHANWNTFYFELLDLACDNFYDQRQYCTFSQDYKRLEISYFRENKNFIREDKENAK